MNQLVVSPVYYGQLKKVLELAILNDLDEWLEHATCDEHCNVQKMHKALEPFKTTREGLEQKRNRALGIDSDTKSVSIQNIPVTKDERAFACTCKPFPPELAYPHGGVVRDVKCPSHGNPLIGNQDDC